MKRGPNREKARPEGAEWRGRARARARGGIGSDPAAATVEHSHDRRGAREVRSDGGGEPGPGLGRGEPERQIGRAHV